MGRRTPWIPGTIVGQTGPVSFQVQLIDGRIRKRHTDHVHSRHPGEFHEVDQFSVEGPSWQEGPDLMDCEAQSVGAERHEVTQANADPGPRVPEAPPSNVCRSTRVRGLPDRLCGLETQGKLEQYFF